MKKLVLVLLFIPLVSFGQDYSNNSETMLLCTSVQSNSFSSNFDAENVLDQILSVTGLSKNFVLSSCDNINNAVAISYKGVRYILYDPEFMLNLSKKTNDWTNYFILAHEIGHHVNGHTVDAVLFSQNIVEPPILLKKRQQELEADQFAAFVLAKLGANLNETLNSVSTISDNDDSFSTHPKRSSREMAINKGFKRGERKTRVAKKSNNRPSNAVNIKNTYETYNIYYGDSIVTKFSDKNILIDQKIYDECTGKGCSSNWILTREYYFFDEFWNKGIDLSVQSKVLVKEKKYEYRVSSGALLVDGEWVSVGNWKTERWLDYEADKYTNTSNNFNNLLPSKPPVNCSENSDTRKYFDCEEISQISRIDGEYISYYETGVVKAYSTFKNNQTKLFITYHRGGQIKKLENVYDNRPYDGKLDKLFHINGTIMMELAPIDLYWENDTGDVFHNNGQLFFKYKVIPQNILNNLTERSFSKNISENSSIKNYNVPPDYIRYYTNIMYHKNGKVFAKLKFDNFNGSTFSECYDEDGNLEDCGNYSSSVLDHLLNVLNYSNILKIN